MMFKNDKKRIYSLNLIAYIIAKTGVQPVFGVDEKRLLYAVFPENKQMSDTIEEWKNPNLSVDIHRFLTVYRDLKQKIIDIKKGVTE